MEIFSAFVVRGNTSLKTDEGRPSKAPMPMGLSRGICNARAAPRSVGALVAGAGISTSEIPNKIENPSIKNS